MKREKREIIYSIGILIMVPLLVITNTVLLVRSTREAFNKELMRKADLVNAVVAESARANIESGQYTTIASTMSALEKIQPSLRGLTLVKEGSDQTLHIIAKSSTATGELSVGAKMQVQIATERKTPVAKFVNVSYGGRTAQAWNVATPLMDDTGNVIAVISSNVLTTDADEAINRAYGISFMVLAVVLVVIMGLLFRHFRLVGYAQLLAKQREVNQTMSDFLSVATHELKAPTSIIKGYLSNIMDGTFGPVEPRIMQQLQTAFSQTDRLNELVRDLLNVSRLEQGRVAYSITNVNTVEIINMIVQNYQLAAHEKDLKLTAQLSAETPMVRGDAGRLQEVFTNLIDNAIKYTEFGEVTVTQVVEGNLLVTKVQDTGFGMSTEARKRLFQRFYRIKTEQTQQIGGTGLGLWIIKHYIEDMGGTIEVESIEGTGSSFIVSMPIARQ